MSDEYPPVTFYFQLSFSGISGSVDASFKEVSGLTMEIGTEEITEDGNNTFKHKVPSYMKYSNLVLKRGLVPRVSPLITWCMNTLDGDFTDSIETRNIVVSLLNANSLPLKSWSFNNAWPVKWSASNFDSMSNEVVIETLEFSYSNFQVLKITR